ncbi:MAG: TerC family protein, partial [Gaiellales bacterium]
AVFPELGAEFFIALLGVVLADLVLAGDNAVVIALAARNLPAHLRRRAVFWGAAAAIVLRGGLTIAAVYLLHQELHYVQLIGGALLLWIAWRLATEEEDHGDGIVAAATIRGAVQTILIADVVMSIDNVLAVAAIARNDIWLVVFGLILSIPIIMGGATLILRIIDRFPIIVLLGAGLITYVGVELMFADPATRDYVRDVFGNVWVERGVAISFAVVFSLLAWSRRGGGESGGEPDDSKARLMVEGSTTDD